MSIVATLSRVLARLGLWYAAAWVLSRQRPLTRLRPEALGQLSYALLMSGSSQPGRTRRLFQTILQAGRGHSPELDLSLAEMAQRLSDLPTAIELLQGARRNAALGSEFEDLAAKSLGLVTALHAGTIDREIEQLSEASGLRAEPPGTLLAIVPLSAGFLELWSLWYEQVAAHLAAPVVVLAMDDAAVAALRGLPRVYLLDVRSHFTWTAAGKLHPRHKGPLWILRTLILRSLVRRGYPTLVLDLDAFVLADLPALLAGLPAADVVAQKDHSLPVDVDRELGFILCCGFLLFYPTPAAQALLDQFGARVIVELDDQMALNHLIARAGIEGRSETPQAMTFRSAGASFVCPDPSLVSRTVDHGAVVRHIQQRGESIPELRKKLGLPEAGSSEQEAASSEQEAAGSGP